MFMCPSLNLYVENLCPPPCDGIGRWDLPEVMRTGWGHQGGRLMNGIVSLQESQDSLLSLSALGHVRTQVGSL